MKCLRIVSQLIVLMLGCFPAAASTLTVGSISNSPDKDIQLFVPLTQYLARQLKDVGIEQGKVVVAKGIPEMAEKLRVRQVDILFDSPYPSVAVSRLADSKILLRRWKKGEAEYTSLFVVRADSAVRSIADLGGKMIALEDSYSTSGYFLPKSALLDAHYSVREYSASDVRLGPKEVGYMFSGEKETTLLWVVRGKVAAGAVGHHDLEQFRKFQPDALRVIHETPALPRHLVSHRKDLDPKLVRRLREVLLAMENSDEGRKVLAAFENTTRFDEIPGGVQKALAPLLRLRREIDRETSRR